MARPPRRVGGVRGAATPCRSVPSWSEQRPGPHQRILAIVLEPMGARAQLRRYGNNLNQAARSVTARSRAPTEWLEHAIGLTDRVVSTIDKACRFEGAVAAQPIEGRMRRVIPRVRHLTGCLDYRFSAVGTFPSWRRDGRSRPAEGGQSRRPSRTSTRSSQPFRIKLLWPRRAWCSIGKGASYSGEGRTCSC